MKKYTEGEEVQRPWGRYVVTKVGYDANGQEFCEKLITIEPGKVLSLQSHDMRRERWTVNEGTLTAIVDGHCMEFEQGSRVEIGYGILHCMANLTGAPCIIHETQVGICREDDIVRYADCDGITQKPVSGKSKNNLKLYAALIDALKSRRVA